MEWEVELRESVPDDFRWFGRKRGQAILKATMSRLANDPLEESKNMKTLRPNRFAQRELRLMGKYRVLFNVNEAELLVTVLVVGEKQGNRLFVQGEEFKSHENDTAE